MSTILKFAYALVTFIVGTGSCWVICLHRRNTSEFVWMQIYNKVQKRPAWQDKKYDISPVDWELSPRARYVPISGTIKRHAIWEVPIGINIDTDRGEGMTSGGGGKREGI